MANYLSRLKRLEAKHHARQDKKRTILAFIENGETEQDAINNWMKANAVDDLPDANWIFIEWVLPN